MPSCQAGDLRELAVYYFYGGFWVRFLLFLYTLNIVMSVFTFKKYVYALSITIQDAL